MTPARAGGAVLAVAVAAVGLTAPTIVRDPYRLSLLINAILLGVSATAIGFLARQSGLMMFGAATFTGGATYIYALRLLSSGSAFWRRARRRWRCRRWCSPRSAR